MVGRRRVLLHVSRRANDECMILQRKKRPLPSSIQRQIEGHFCKSSYAESLSAIPADATRRNADVQQVSHPDGVASPAKTDVLRRHKSAATERWWKFWQHTCYAHMTGKDVGEFHRKGRSARNDLWQSRDRTYAREQSVRTLDADGSDASRRGRRITLAWISTCSPTSSTCSPGGSGRSWRRCRRRSCCCIS